MAFNDDDSNIDAVLVALAAGIGIGFGLGILFAPRSGAKTRAALARSANRSLEQVKDTVDDIRSSASDLVEKGKRAVDDHKETLAQAIEGAKKTYRNVTS